MNRNVWHCDQIAPNEAATAISFGLSVIQRNTFAALALACFGILLLSLGAWVFTQEGGTYFLHAATPVTSIDLRSESDPVGLGITTRRDVLEECDNTLRSARSFELMLLPAVEFADLRGKCAGISETIAQDSPSFSLAWAVAARAAAAGSDWARMNQFLKASQQTGPNEQWIGRIRFEVADANFEQLNAEGRALYDKDLEMLILSNKGIPYIARQYVLDVSFRVRMTKVLEGMDEADQRRYISVLRRMVPR